MFRDRPHQTRVGLALALAATVALSGCGGGNESASSSGPAQPVVSGERAGAAGGASDSAAQSAPGAPGKAAGGSSAGNAAIDPASLTAAPDQLARRAAIAVQVKNIGQAVAKVRSTAAAADGIVLSENIGTGGGGDVPLADSARVTATTYGEITISVPSTELDSVIAELGGIGTVIRSTSASENVGGQIVDTQSRLATMRVSVERVRGFLAQSKDLTQIVAMEAELTRRQADLESLEAQLASLKGSVARSPVQVSLTTEPGVIAQEPRTGFLVGLTGGWDAFTGSVAVVLTILGAVLPFGVVIALVGAPIWWVLRRRRATATAATAAPATVLPQ